MKPAPIGPALQLTAIFIVAVWGPFQPLTARISYLFVLITAYRTACYTNLHFLHNSGGFLTQWVHLGWEKAAGGLACTPSTGLSHPEVHFWWGKTAGGLACPPNTELFFNKCTKFGAICRALAVRNIYRYFLPLTASSCYKYCCPAHV